MNSFAHSVYDVLIEKVGGAQQQNQTNELFWGFYIFTHWSTQEVFYYLGQRTKVNGPSLSSPGNKVMFSLTNVS